VFSLSYFAGDDHILFNEALILMEALTILCENSGLYNSGFATALSSYIKMFGFGSV